MVFDPVAACPCDCFPVFDPFIETEGAKKGSRRWTSSDQFSGEICNLVGDEFVASNRAKKIRVWDPTDECYWVGNPFVDKRGDTKDGTLRYLLNDTFNVCNMPCPCFPLTFLGMPMTFMHWTGLSNPVAYYTSNYSRSWSTGTPLFCFHPFDGDFDHWVCCPYSGESKFETVRIYLEPTGIGGAWKIEQVLWERWLYEFEHTTSIKRTERWQHRANILPCAEVDRYVWNSVTDEHCEYKYFNCLDYGDFIDPYPWEECREFCNQGNDVACDFIESITPGSGFDPPTADADTFDWDPLDLVVAMNDNAADTVCLCKESQVVTVSSDPIIGFSDGIPVYADCRESGLHPVSVFPTGEICHETSPTSMSSTLRSRWVHCGVNQDWSTISAL